MWPCSLGVVLSVKFLYERFFDGTPLLRENRDTHRNSGKKRLPGLMLMRITKFIGAKRANG